MLMKDRCLQFKLSHLYSIIYKQFHVRIMIILEADKYKFKKRLTGLGLNKLSKKFEKK